MDVLNRTALISLAGHRGWPSISAYLPTHRLPRQQAEDRLRLKNLLRDAAERLVQEGMRTADAEAACAPMRAMLEDDTFWRDTSDGLAVFISPTETRALRVDAPLPEQLVVGDRYYVRPLINAYRVSERFWALALDKNRTRLFRGDRSFVEEVPLLDTPLSFEEAMKYEEAQANLTTRSFMAGRPASRGNQHEGSVYAGYGGEKDVEKEQTTRFARSIERGVAAAIGTDAAPLLLFGTERLLVAYREGNTLESLASEQVTGASDYLSPQQIQQTSLQTLAPRFEQAIEADLAELTEREGSALVSHDPAEIVSAAAAGRVKTLFFDESVGPFGQFDAETFEVSQVCAASPRYLRAERDPVEAGDGECGWDLVDLAAAETTLHGGEVHAFLGEHPPVRGVAAIYRY